MKSFYQYAGERETQEDEMKVMNSFRCREASMIALLEMLERYVLMENPDTKGVLEMLGAYLPVVKKTFEDYSGDLFKVAEKAAEVVKWHKKNAPPSSEKMDS